MIMTARRPSRHPLGNFPSRLLQCQGLGEDLGVDLWVKHEFEVDGLGAGEKVRKLEYLLPEALKRGCERLLLDGTTQSNCAMALSHYGPPAGLGVDLVLYGSPVPQGNYRDILRSGARITLLSAWSVEGVAAAREQTVRRNAAAGRRTYEVPTGATSEVTVFGAIDLAEELARQEDEAGISLDYLVCPTGTGGTYVGLEIGRCLMGRSWRVIGVAVANDERFFSLVADRILNSPRIADLMTSAKEAFCLDIYSGALGDGYGVPLPDAHNQIASLRQRYGIVLDTVYTHKALMGVREAVEQGRIARGSSVAFIHTGGTNERFLHESSLV